MSWREVLEAPSHNSHYPQKGNCEDIGNNGVRGSEKNSGNHPSVVNPEKSNSDPYTHNSCYSHKDRMPTAAELMPVCRDACRDKYIKADDLAGWLIAQADPEWVTPHCVGWWASFIERHGWPKD